jgi:hypothetical protein
VNHLVLNILICFCNSNAFILSASSNDFNQSSISLFTALIQFLLLINLLDFANITFLSVINAFSLFETIF